MRVVVNPNNETNITRRARQETMKENRRVKYKSSVKKKNNINQSAER